MRKLLLVLLLVSPLLGFGQGYMLDYFNTKRQKINKTGMVVLGSWAVGNIGVNGYYWSQTNGSVKYFHQMNTYWNIANLGFAGYGYYRFAKEDIKGYDMEQSTTAYHKNVRTYLINAVLDVGYIGTGIYLQSIRPEHPHKTRLLGYGQAVFWQGVFLVVFDSAMFIAHEGNKKKSNIILEDFSFNGNSVGVRLAF